MNAIFYLLKVPFRFARWFFHDWDFFDYTIAFVMGAGLFILIYSYYLR